MKIKRIIIDNFRAFGHEVIEFDDFNCIIGKNDSGKSTILAAMEWFFSDKELGNYDINTNVENEAQEISVELFFTDATFHPEFISKEFLGADDTVCIKKSLSNPMLFDSKFVKPMPYYSLRIFKFKDRMDKCILSFGKCEDLMKECYDLGINKDYLKGIIASFEKCSDKRSISSFRSRHNSLIPKMRQSLYNYYSKRNYQVIEDERRFSESEWFEWMYESCFFSVPLFELYKPSTPINFHLNKLFNKSFCIKDDKKTEEITKNISDRLSTNVFFEDIPCDFFPTRERLSLIFEKELKMVSVQNRGEGVLQKLKYEIIKMYAEQSESCIFAFEEPETNLHPSAQLEMYNSIKELSKSNQVIITTHSPYIVKKLAEDNIKPIVVKRDVENNVSSISQLDEQVLAHDDYVSMNEINYIAFEEPTVEYHQELFAFLQGGEKTVDGVDAMFEQKYDWFQIDNKGKLVMVDGSPIERKHSLPYCVRNQIDHPNDKNKKYADREIRKASIDIMREAILKMKETLS